MTILGIESSSLVASAAVVRDGVMLAEYTVNSKKTHSQTLMPMIEAAVKSAGIEDLREISAVAVSAGPGSFTGLRIGSSIAKGMAFVLNCPVAGVPTLDAMAYQLYGAAGYVCPMMDARREQVYTGIYAFEKEARFDFPRSVMADSLTVMNVLVEQCVMPVEELAKKLNSMGEAVTFLGDGCVPYRDILKSKLAVPFRFAPEFAAGARAGAVAGLGCQYAKNGRLETAAKHAPMYLRQSQAELVKEQKESV